MKPIDEPQYFVVRKTYPANNSVAIIHKEIVSNEVYLSDKYKPYREAWKTHPQTKGDIIEYGACINSETAIQRLLATI